MRAGVFFNSCRKLYILILASFEAGSNYALICVFTKYDKQCNIGEVYFWTDFPNVMVQNSTRLRIYQFPQMAIRIRNVPDIPSVGCINCCFACDYSSIIGCIC